MAFHQKTRFLCWRSGTLRCSAVQTQKDKVTMHDGRMLYEPRELGSATQRTVSLMGPFPRRSTWLVWFKKNRKMRLNMVGGACHGANGGWSW